MMDEGIPLIPVPLTFNTSRPSTFPKLSRNLSSLEHPDKLGVFRDIKLHIALGRLERFLHFLRSNFVRLVKCSNNNDRTFRTLSLKQSSDKRDIFPLISRNFFSLEQPPRSIISSDSKLILWGRLLRHLQPFKSN